MPVHRGEIYFVELGPTVGHEQAGRRPVVVVSNDQINRQPLVVLMVPGTRAKRAPVPYPNQVLVPQGHGGLSDATVFMAFQCRALDQRRFREPPRGILSPHYLEQIERALIWRLDLARQGP